MMKSSFAFAVLASDAALAAAHLARPPPPGPDEQAPLKASKIPCELVLLRADAYFFENPQDEFAPLRPSEVYACFQDVPLYPDTAVAQIDWMQPFLQFQSTLAYLEDPPSFYQLPPVDVFGGLDNISKAVTAERYKTLYDFELDLYNLIGSARDGHLGYEPYLVGAAQFTRNASLVSVSLNGIEMPRVYFQSDIVALSDSGVDPSPLASINGQEIGQSMDNFALQSWGFQDLDAQYNSLLYDPATTISDNQKNLGGFSKSFFTTHDDYTTCKFANGTETLLEHTAHVPRPLIQRSGEEIFQFLVSTEDFLSMVSPHKSPDAKPITDSISGQFLEEIENSDVAVLDIVSFAADNGAEYQNYISTFLKKCHSAGKKRLIIDVRGNPGGSIILGYDLFEQLFPTLVPYCGLRMRGSAAANAIGQYATDHTLGLDWTFFNAPRNLQRLDGSNFTSWEEFYGPLEQHGDLFSNIASWNFINETIVVGKSRVVIRESADEPSIPPQVFASDSITLLTDGQCSSTCAVFSDLLIRQGYVKTATAGGRPNKHPMAVIGGVRGAQVLWFNNIGNLAKTILDSETNALPTHVKEVLEPLAMEPPMKVYGSPSINALDSIAQGDTSMTPLQFTAPTTANCRFFYIPSDIVNVTNTWNRVAKGIKAGGSSLCINGTLRDLPRVDDPASRNGSTTFYNFTTDTGRASTGRCAQLTWVGLSVVIGSLVAALL